MTVVALVHDSYPCCGGGARIPRASTAAVFYRECPDCGIQWEAHRRAATPGISAKVGRPVDRLDWHPLTGPGGTAA